MIFFQTDITGINRFYKMNRDSGRAKPGDFLYAAKQDDQILSALIIRSYNEFFLMRSLFTASNQRRGGIASGLVRYALQHHDGNVLAIPTPEAFSFYQHCGFRVLPAEEIPIELVNTYRRVRQTGNGAPVMAIRSRLR